MDFPILFIQHKNKYVSGLKYKFSDLNDDSKYLKEEVVEICNEPYIVIKDEMCEKNKKFMEMVLIQVTLSQNKIQKKQSSI